MSNIREVEIGPIEQESRGGVNRVSAVVAGAPVWFESTDTLLAPSAEAFANLFLVPALHYKLPMRLHGRLCREWRQNVQQVAAVMNEWWEYPMQAEIEDQGPAAPGPRLLERMQCFSGGCDSFYTLLRGKHATKYLVYVNGFDISYRDAHRMRAIDKSIREVAAATSRTALVVRTNVRKHPLFASVPWERTHGGALAAVGHLLSQHAGGIVIPSSYPYEQWAPVGTHWLIDRHFSAANLEVIHDEPGYRLDKLRKIADEPLLHRHLRVCWQNFAASGNCSFCDKCVRTMVVLACCGQLQNYTVFDRETPLATILDRMEPVPENVLYRYHQLIEQGVPKDVEEAMLRLVARRRPNGITRIKHLYRKARSTVLQLTG